jgi:hypothetical protein
MNKINTTNEMNQVKELLYLMKKHADNINYDFSENKLKELLNIINVAWVKGQFDRIRGFVPSNEMKEQIGKEIAYNMKNNAVPYLIELLNTLSDYISNNMNHEFIKNDQLQK